MFNRRKSTVGRHDVESMNAQREAQRTLLLETVEVFLPMLMREFVEAEKRHPETKKITVFVREYHDGRFEFSTFPETERRIIPNQCKSTCRDILNKMMEIAEDHDFKAQPIESQWDGWVYSFVRNYP